jgi:hypothetical protein
MQDPPANLVVGFSMPLFLEIRSRAYFKVKADRMLDWERRMCHAADGLVAVSPQDAAVMRISFGIEAVSLAAAVDLDYFGRPLDTPRQADPLFLGSMERLLNSDGLNYFVRDILPQTWQSMPNCKLAVVGRAPSSVILALAQEDSRTDIRGTVPDVWSWLWGASSRIDCPATHRWRHSAEDLRS